MEERRGRYWDRKRETMPPGERDELILARIRHQLSYAYEKIPFYRRLYDRRGVRPGDVDSLAALPPVRQKTPAWKARALFRGR